jgi:beta-galactosidase
MPDNRFDKDVFFPAILHGGDYNPEQWPESVWDDDVRLMQEAHVNVATVPVFGWVHLQTDEETYTFEWLDRVLDKLHAGGIRACLATATASVPAWMDQKYPDILRVDRDGVKQKHGGRHTFCPNSANFRRLSTALARKMAERYKDHPALTVWHVSNEYGNYCYCDTCAAEFRGWLKERYGSLDELNRRWYTSFWGHTYTDWSQIETPTTNGEGSMQSLFIDYDRFQSDSILACYVAEARVLREVTPQIPITTNMMGAFKPLDYQKWAKELDIVSWDSYPRKYATPADIAFPHALMRGLKDGQPFMLMEQTPSQQNWQAQNALKRPGVLRLWSFQAMAHGADTVMYFQWRRSRGGTEKYHGAVVEHVGTSEPRVFKEVAALGEELERLSTRTLGGRVKAEAAILFDWDNWRAVEYSSGPSVDLRYVPQCLSYFAALQRMCIPTDVVSPSADLSRYKLVIAPVLYMVKPGVAENIEKFVDRGGSFLTTFFSGIVDETDLVYLGGYPGPLRRLLGIWSEEIDALAREDTNQVVFGRAYGALNGQYVCNLLCDRIHAEGAQVIATYGSDFYAGAPALTVNHFGKGRAYYLATALEEKGLSDLIRALTEEAGIASVLPGAPAGVEAMPRISPSGETLLYILNHNNEPADTPLPAGSFTDLLSSKPCKDKLTLPSYGVAILAKE